MTGIDMTSGGSDRGLRAVVAVARAGSFTGAAHDLGIGQSAVSHAVARFERALGVALFDRRRDGVVPTAAGLMLVERVEPALADIDAAVEAAAQTPADGSVTISVSTSLAAYWLTPRLPEFKREHPEVELRVLTTDTDREVGRDDADLWIPLGAVDRADLESVPFCAERLIPVAAPSLAAELDLRDVAALREVPLLHLEERYRPRFDWSRWFAHHDVAVEGVLPGDRSNDYSLVLLAALAGTGVALGWDHIVRELIDEGRLAPVGPAVETGVAFPLLSRRGRPLTPAATTLRRWLLEHAPGRP
ncbi:MAG: LysR substrate-binding domain-containing protein [Actinomycetota bacterium]